MQKLYLFRILSGSVKSGLLRIDLWLPGFLTALLSPGILLYPVLSTKLSLPLYLLNLRTDTVILTAFCIAAAVVVIFYLGSIAQVRLIEKVAGIQTDTAWTAGLYLFLLRLAVYSSLFYCIIRLRGFRLYSSPEMYNISSFFASASSAAFLLIFLISSVSFSYAIRIAVLENKPVFRAVREGIRLFWQNPSRSIGAAVMNMLQILCFVLIGFAVLVLINIIPGILLFTDPLSGLKALSVTTFLITVPACLFIWAVAGTSRDIYWTNTYLEIVKIENELQYNPSGISADNT